MESPLRGSLSADGETGLAGISRAGTGGAELVITRLDGNSTQIAANDAASHDEPERANALQ